MVGQILASCSEPWDGDLSEADRESLKDKRGILLAEASRCPYMAIAYIHPSRVFGVCRAGWASENLGCRSQGVKEWLSQGHTFISPSQEQGPCFSLHPSMPLSPLLPPPPLNAALISSQTHKEGES